MGELLRILQRTAVSVVIFSSQFADSSLCLDEVHTVAQCVQNWRHRALPIFYNVDWTTVAGDYNWFHDFKSVFCSCFLPRDATLYAKTIAGLDATQKRKDEWMKSLKVVASKTGRTSESFPVEAGLIEEVVSQILTKLATMSSAIEFNNLVGMASRISEVDRLLAMDATDDAIRIVGLWGMGGLGKSVLARACYERLKGLHREEMKFHFVDKINETCDKQYLIEGLVHEMYSTLLSESYLTWDDVGVDYRRARLCRLKVFVVLDDVQTPSQLEQFFLGEALSLVKLFAAGSRIIITTRNQRVINYVKAEMYPVEHLNDVQSLQLFKMHAFQPAGSVQDDDRIRINDLSRKVVAYCKGNPLALTVLGGRLLPKDKTYWESFLCKLGKIQLPGIYRVLKRSYDELGDDDKRLFLDVACFFHGIWKTSLVKYMGTSYSSSYSRIEDLTGKSLLISEKKIQGEVVVVHSLLREMAWNIVNEEENTGKRSRLNDPRDIHYLLTVREKQLLLSNCPNLTRCPEVNSVQLQALDLDGTPINSLPNAIYKVTEKGMVSLYGPCITLSPQIATRLGLLGLRQTAIANFELDCNGGRLDKFDRMHLIQNAQLTTLPTSVWNKVSDELIIEDCPLIGCLPVISEPYSHIGELVQLSHLDISYSRDLESVPSTINELAKLSELLLTGCGSLESLPELLPPNLIVLKANDCVSLRALSQNIRNLNLQHLSLDGCPLLEKYLVDEIVANFPDQQGELCNDDPDQQGELCNDDRELLDRDSCGMLVSMEMDFDCY
ncbi:Disease resistance-like protein DSC1 [Linum perenne]